MRKPLTVRIEAVLLEQLDKLLEITGRTRNAEICHALAWWVAKRAKELETVERVLRHKDIF